MPLIKIVLDSPTPKWVVGASQVVGAATPVTGPDCQGMEGIMVSREVLRAASSLLPEFLCGTGWLRQPFL